MQILQRGTGEGLFDEVAHSTDSLLDQLIAVATHHLRDDRVTVAELVLQTLRAAQTLELAVDHDRHARAQRLALLHTTTTQNSVITCLKPCYGLNNIVLDLCEVKTRVRPLRLNFVNASQRSLRATGSIP